MTGADGHPVADPAALPAASRDSPAVVVVDAKTPGNVGTIARAMKNFGLSTLLLVDPPTIEENGEAYGFAGHAREDVLPNATRVTFDAVAERYHTVGFTAITNEDSRNHVRFPYTTPAALTDDLRTLDAEPALMFGREGEGLHNDELAACDRVASIPASESYPVMNLGQAATVTLYELRELTLSGTQLPDVERHRADQAEVERVTDYWERFLTELAYPEHKREKSSRLLGRVLGRAHPTDREATTLMGILRRATDQLAGADPPGERDDGDGSNDDDSRPEPERT
ncbi:MAG: RNA methyltransferase [Halolamina sp.]